MPILDYPAGVTPTQGFYEHVVCSWTTVPERERAVVLAVERSHMQWRRSSLFWVRLGRLQRLSAREVE